MSVSLRFQSQSIAAAVAGVGVFADQLDHCGLDPVTLRQLNFEAKPEQICTLPGPDGPTLAIGLGDSTKVTVDGFRRAAAAFVKAARSHGDAVLTLADLAPADLADCAAQAVAEGLVLGSYEFLRHKSKPTAATLTDVTVVVADASQEAAQRGQTIAEATCWVRDRVNEPGGSLTPDRLAELASKLGKKAGFDVKVLKRGEIAALGMGGLLGVNRGSSNPPRFICATYKPKGKTRAKVALIGKGITFDSGGLSLKTAAGMMTMKCDMAGGAAVLGAVSAAAQLGLDIEVRGYVPATDNMTGPDATRPGDVLRLRNGKTIEVLNTDAEGRLILADALAYASEDHPDAMIDLATLTGACMVALGPRIAGVMGNDDAWLSEIESSAQRTGEQVWRLPLPPEYRKQFESPVADMKNIGTPYGGALTAGLILQEFVGEGIPWAHLDIAGPAFSESDEVDAPKGGSGFGVRLLVDLLRTFQAAERPEEPAAATPAAAAADASAVSDGDD